MASRTLVFALTALVAGAGLAASCKSSTNACSGTPANLVGTYALVSYTTGTTTIPVPPASGTLHFYASLYAVNLTLPGPTVVADSGSYSLCGSSGISESSVLGLPQFTGTYTFVRDTLSVTGTAAGTAAANVWAKRP